MEFDFDRVFAVRDAVAAGTSRSRLRRRDLRAEFHGSRVPASAGNDLRTRCFALQAVLDGRHAFTGVTAARLWGMPLPRRFEAASDLQVASVSPTRAIRHAGVTASVRPAWWEVVDLQGLRVHAPVEAWASLARVLSPPDLIAAAEYLVSPARRGVPALVPREDLRAWVARAAGMTGSRALRAADARVRVGARSRPETLLRLLLEDCELPRARINEDVVLRTGRVVAPDLAWPQYRVAVEYDGDYHRDRRQFTRDLVRTDELTDEGWSVVHVVAAQLFGRPSEIAARVIGRLAARGAPTRSVTRFAVYEP
ncbi:MAG TPA: hypothetical protein VNR36_09145 [Pseudolysinimonas sp.]|nr:hypothetical protein [Pseudolysinimonas sp.]